MKSTNKKVNFILDVYNEKCPKCRKGYVFKQNVSVLNLPVMNDVCDKCNYHFESGTDLRYIQELLGHKSSKTTEIYTHVSTKNIQQIKSPFDDL